MRARLPIDVRCWLPTGAPVAAQTSQWLNLVYLARNLLVRMFRHASLAGCDRPPCAASVARQRLRVTGGEVRARDKGSRMEHCHV